MADGGELSLIDKNISSLFEIPLNPSVRSLNLHCNGLSKIEGLLTAWYIRHLDLSSNKISCIEGLESLTSLQTLNLSCNLISKVEGLHGLVSLKRLNLSYNQISDLTGFLYLHGNEYKLKHLYLQCNRVNSMSQLLQCMRGLQSLRSVTLNLEGSRNPVCDTPGREVSMYVFSTKAIIEERDQERERRWKAEQALKKLTEQLQNLQTQASEEKNLQNLTKRIQELENQVAALRREIEILRALAQQRKDKLHQLHELLASREQSHRKELESWIHPKGPEFHEAVAQAAAVSEQHHSQQLADLQEKLTEARQRYTDLEDEFRMALTIEAARFAEVKEGFNLQAAELTDCKAALAMSRQKEQQSATLVQELTSMVKEQKTRIAELIKSKREAVTDLKARVRTLEATVEDDKHRRLQLELLKQEKFKLLSELATQESVIDGLRAERKIWGQELAQQASLAQDRGRLEARIEVLSTEVQTLRKQNESDNKTLKIKAKIVEDNTETIRKLKEGLQERDEQTRHLREESVQAQRRFQAQLEEETVHLGELREQVEQLIARKEELKQQLEDKEAELGEVKKEHSVMKRKWKDKAELLTQLEFQVKRMKESFDSKEKLLADEREKAVQAHKAALEKLRCVDNAFQRQMEAVQASHQAELLQLASDKQKEIELANHRVVQVEEEMRQLLEETKHKKRTMEEKMRCLSSVLKEF
uniref:Leucine rich repeat and coiled-coil centrosomal protein 1 n=1 Tax=Scleropages formosus TaxID=113540 RepID=A0A8C9SVR0_SCLFO